MKKYLALLLAAVLLLSLTACGKTASSKKDANDITVIVENETEELLQNISVTFYIDDDAVATDVACNADGSLLGKDSFDFLLASETLDADDWDDSDELALNFSVTEADGTTLELGSIGFRAKRGESYTFRLSYENGGYRIGGDMGGIINANPVSGETPAAAPLDIPTLYEKEFYYNDACPETVMWDEGQQEKVFLSIEDNYIAVLELDDDNEPEEPEAILPYGFTIDNAILAYTSIDFSDLDGDGYSDPTVTFDTGFDGSPGRKYTLVWFHTGEDTWTLNEEFSTLPGQTPAKG